MVLQSGMPGKEHFCKFFKQNRVSILCMFARWLPGKNIRSIALDRKANRCFNRQMPVRKPKALLLLFSCSLKRVNSNSNELKMNSLSFGSCPAKYRIMIHCSIWNQSTLHFFSLLCCLRLPLFIIFRPSHTDAEREYIFYSKELLERKSEEQKLSYECALLLDPLQFVAFNQIHKCTTVSIIM